MKWAQIDQFHWRRECGRYFVDQTLDTQRAGGSRYCAWFKPREGSMAELLACKDELRDATAVCSAHLRKLEASAARVTEDFCERDTQQPASEPIEAPRQTVPARVEIHAPPATAAAETVPTTSAQVALF